VANLPGLVNELSLTDHHVVVRMGRKFLSVPKEGGTVRELATVPDTEELMPRYRMRRAARTVDHPTLRQRQFIRGGNRVWFETTRTRSAPVRFVVYSVAADGSDIELKRMADTSIVTWTAPASVPWCVENPSHAVYLAPQWTPTAGNRNRADFGDQPIVAYAAADWTVLIEVGRFPEPVVRSGTLQFPALVSKTEMYGEPLQFGEAGLLPIRGRTQTTNGTAAGTDLLYFKTDEPGLVPVTHYGVD